MGSSLWGSEGDLDGPSGALTQVRIVSPLAPETLPVRRSRTWPEQSRPTQVWQMPIRQPYGRVAPASSPATRIGVVPSLEASMPLSAKRIVPPAPCSASSEPMIGLEALHVKAARVALALPVLAQRVEQVGGPADERLALAPVGAQLVEIGRDPCGPSRR